MVEHQHCACIPTLILAIENGALDGVVIGALQGVQRDHPAVRYSRSIGKRVRGAVVGRLRELLGVRPPSVRFDPWKQHCRTCACPAEAFARTGVQSGPPPPPADQDPTEKLRGRGLLHA